MPNDFDVAKSVAKLVYDAWSPINRDQAARNAFWLFCSLMRFSDQEIEPMVGKVAIRAKSRSGIMLEASGENACEAFERLMGKV
jgi:hypothetical protein